MLVSPKQRQSHARLASQEGPIAIVTDVGCGMRWMLVALETNAPERTAKSRGTSAADLKFLLRLPRVRNRGHDFV